MMLDITEEIRIPLCDIELTAIRAQGPGGQNVNKVATAIHLRFDTRHPALPSYCQQRLLECGDQRITREGIVIIKAQNGRSQQQSKTEALRRLKELIIDALAIPTVRYATRPGRAAHRRRMDQKNNRGVVKALRGKVRD